MHGQKSHLNNVMGRKGVQQDMYNHRLTLDGDIYPSLT